jgi:NAD+ synthase
MDNYNRIINGLKAYKEETNCKGVVVGISGGKDSTVVAMLLKKVWGDNVVGVIMPNGAQKDLQDALDIVKTINLKHYVINIKETVDSIIKNSPVELGDKEKSNIPPRVRMTYLYAAASIIRGVVANTSNYSEAFLGYETKWGDMCGDFGLLSAYTVNEVLAIGRVLVDMGYCDMKHIEKTPEDGLTHKTDEDIFGFSYEELDNYIMYEETPCTEKLNNIIYMNKNSKHKRNCINIPHPAPLGVWRNNNFQTYGGIVLNI